MPSDDFVNQSAYAQQAQQASGAPAAAGMPAYPLYGLPAAMGQAEVAIPFYHRPLFCYSVGAAVGFGAAYFVFVWLKPRMKANPSPAKEASK